MRFSQLLAATAALSTATVAWPDALDALDAPNAVANAKQLLYPRQDEATTTTAPSSTADASESTDSTTTGRPSASSTNNDDATTTGSGSGASSPTATNDSSGSQSSGRPKATKFGNDVPAGGVAMITPGVFDGTQYYKIGDWVHLAWNYTSLRVTPVNVDVMATCTQNQATYTIAVNQSVQATGEVFWDTSKYAEDHPNSPPLLMAMYTLLIYDSNLTASSTPRPGHLATYNQHAFGMYEKQPYQNWTEGYTCPTCNSALSSLQALTVKAMLITSTTTVASLVYFSYSFGLL